MREDVERSKEGEQFKYLKRSEEEDNRGKACGRTNKKIAIVRLKRQVKALMVRR
jgi:hypothetical protein